VRLAGKDREEHKVAERGHDGHGPGRGPPSYAVAFDAVPKGARRQVIHDLREDRFAGVHGWGSPNGGNRLEIVNFAHGRFKSVTPPESAFPY